MFAGALLYGRIYCGWMCPQTTLSEIVSSVERWVCKKRKGSAPCRVAGPAASLFMGAFVSASMVSYFLGPADRLHPSGVAWSVWAISTAIIGADLLILRHRFCLGICPYGILQNIIQDGRTLGVELDPARRGECTDCLLCVRACFMGVDIRDQGFDTRCLNCGDCISATRLAKRCPADPLIRFRYGTEPSRWPAFLRKLGILDARRAIVMALVVVVTGITAGLLASRRDLDLDIAAQYERVSTEAGLVHNFYRLSVGNRLHRPVRLRIEANGIPGLVIASPPPEIELAAGERGIRDVVLTAPASGLDGGAHAITVRGVAGGSSFAADLSTRFFVPNQR